ncbi:MAG: hypothetical protein ACREH5_06720, partial [Candidatus Omnitrophota bacterium]
WREEDNDFDGKIDFYREKGAKGPSAKIGKPIDLQRFEDSHRAKMNVGDERPMEKQKGETPADKRMKEMNERYGIA